MGSSRQELHRGDYIGFAAFGGVVLGSFSSFLFQNNINAEPWELISTFVLGGLFLTLGVLSNRYVEDDIPSRNALYFVLQAAICLGCIWISPVRGFFGILPLPLASQCVFLFRWKTAIGCGLFLYAMTSMVYYPDYGWSGFGEAMMAYSPGYLFTIGFSFVTVDAVRGRMTAASLTEELETANAQLRAHAAQAEELATTRERNRLAREIHDGVGHYLTVINVQVEAARTLLDTDPQRSRQALDKVARLSRDALEDVRRSVGSLRSDKSSPPLTDTLQALVKDAEIPVKVTVRGEPRQLSSASEHALFRAAQEGITNISKHASAKHSWIELDFTSGDRTRLIVTDDGRGPSDQETTGYGLRGMHERVELLGGEVRSGRRAAGGFELHVEVPA